MSNLRKVLIQFTKDIINLLVKVSLVFEINSMFVTLNMEVIVLELFPADSAQAVQRIWFEL